MGADPVLRTSDRSDYQANGVMALAKRLGRSPRDVAEEIVGHVDLDGVATVEVAGPGILESHADAGVPRRSTDTRLRGDERLGIERVAESQDASSSTTPRRTSPRRCTSGNLRSTVIGDALARMYRFAGHDVIARNHVGDWGTPFAMLIEHSWTATEHGEARRFSIGDLDGFYKEARTKFDADETFKERSRARVVALQSGDPETLRLWRVIVDQSIAYLDLVYQDLGITLTVDDVVGESFYNDMLEDVVADLVAAGLIVESGGALCVFPPGFTNRDGEALPLIVRKSDEGFGYAASDLAAVRDRVDNLTPTRCSTSWACPRPSTSRWSSPSRAWPAGCPIACAVST